MIKIKHLLNVITIILLLSSFITLFVLTNIGLETLCIYTIYEASKYFDKHNKL